MLRTHFMFLAHLAKAMWAFAITWRPSSVAKFGWNWLSSFRGEDFKKSANQKQELPVVAMFVNGSEQNEQYL
jgi:hypothetical protein